MHRLTAASGNKAGKRRNTEKAGSQRGTASCDPQQNRGTPVAVCSHRHRDFSRGGTRLAVPGALDSARYSSQIEAAHG